MSSSKARPKAGRHHWKLLPAAAILVLVTSVALASGVAARLDEGNRSRAADLVSAADTQALQSSTLETETVRTVFNDNVGLGPRVKVQGRDLLSVFNAAPGRNPVGKITVWPTDR